MTQEIKQRIEQIKRREVPQGYKRTKVGIVPSEWEETTFATLGDYKKGKEVSAALTMPTGLPAMMYGDIYIKYNTLFYITDFKISKETAIKSTPVYKGDLLFTCSGETAIEIGKCVCYQGEDVVYIGGDILALSPVNADSVFLAYQQNSDTAIKQKARLGQGHSVVHIYLNSIKSLNIALPFLAEQQKIAEILTMQDKVIELKEKLLAQKQQQKKWLMQNLLTGKKRLSGFSGEWKKIKLGELFSERTERNAIHLPLLAITGTKGVVPRSDLDLKDNSSEDKSKYLKICIGDIGYNTMRMWQGVSAFSEYEGIVSPAYTILKPKENINAKYFSYLFKMPSQVFMFYRFSQGLVDDTRNLKYSNFKQIRVCCPTNLKEQTAIAEILSTADREIDLMKKDFDAEKQKKKALMQLLLTGMVRV